MDSVDICRDHEIWDPFLGCQRIGNIGGFVLQNVLFGFVIQRPIDSICGFWDCNHQNSSDFWKKRRFLLEPLPLLFKKSKDLRFSKFDFEKPNFVAFWNQISSVDWDISGIHSEDGLEISKLQYEYTYAVYLYVYIYTYILIYIYRHVFPNRCVKTY